LLSVLEFITLILVAVYLCSLGTSCAWNICFSNLIIILPIQKKKKSLCSW
jgi:hypothetical protein